MIIPSENVIPHNEVVRITNCIMVLFNKTIHQEEQMCKLIKVTKLCYIHLDLHILAVVC